MRWRAVGIAVIASVLAACSGSAGSSPSPLPSASAAPPASPPWTAGPTPTGDGAVETVAPTAAASTPSAALGLVWAQQHVDKGRAGSSLAHGPGGWAYLVSTDGEYPLTPDVAFSPDLRTWRLVTPPGDVVACGDGGGMAATATTWLLRCGGVFRSVDGRTWERVTGLPEAVREEIVHLVSDGRTFLAWRGEYPADTAVWSSPDGSSWTRVALPDAPFVVVDAVIGRPGRGFVVAGRTAPSADDLREAYDQRWSSLPGGQAIWTSEDGATWTALPLGAAFDGGRITGLAAGGPGGGLLAVGYIGAPDETSVARTAVWRSADLRTWARLDDVAREIVEPFVGQARAVATSERWLLIGARLRGGPDEDLTAMGVTAGSEDGSTWWAIPPIRFDERSYSIIDVVGTDRQLVVLGLVAPGGLAEDTLVWVSPPLD